VTVAGGAGRHHQRDKVFLGMDRVR
jgi:hypothetical protein